MCNEDDSSTRLMQHGLDCRTRCAFRARKLLYPDEDTNDIYSEIGNAYAILRDTELRTD
jgi:hypothetical protein